nr:MAG TPA: hypothetical protein [Caudoviricetes sp.]
MISVRTRHPAVFLCHISRKLPRAIAPGLLSGPHGNKKRGFKDFGFTVLFVENKIFMCFYSKIQG